MHLRICIYIYIYRYNIYIYICRYKCIHSNICIHSFKFLKDEQVIHRMWCTHLEYHLKVVPPQVKCLLVESHLMKTGSIYLP